MPLPAPPPVPAASIQRAGVVVAKRRLSGSGTSPAQKLWKMNGSRTVSRGCRRMKKWGEGEGVECRCGSGAGTARKAEIDEDEDVASAACRPTPKGAREGEKDASDLT